MGLSPETMDLISVRNERDSLPIWENVLQADLKERLGRAS